jgi:hypothetical protein
MLRRESNHYDYDKTDIIVSSMTPWFSSDTYHLNRLFRAPAIRGFLIFIILGLLVIAGLQWLGQSAWSASLPPPSLDFNNPEFNIKINYLDALFRHYGKIDCLLVGSSQVNSGLDPLTIDQTYRTQTGQEIHCFNFGLGTLTTDTAGPLVTMLVERYHPRMLVFEISARSFDKHFGNLARPLAQNAWIRYYLGERTPEGWVLDNFYAYRYYITFKVWQYPYNRDVILNTWRAMDQAGFSALNGSNNTEGGHPLTIDFHIEAPNWSGFKQVLSLQGKTHLILMEAPVREAYLPFYLEGGINAYETDFIQPVEAELSARGIPFWRAQTELAPKLPDTMWFDDRHVNAPGAFLFSTWLAQKMAEEIPPDLFR